MWEHAIKLFFHDQLHCELVKRKGERLRLEKTRGNLLLASRSHLNYLITIKGSYNIELLSTALLVTISGNECTLGARWFIIDNLV